VYIRYFWQGNHHTYGHIRCVYTVLANPIWLWPIISWPVRGAHTTAAANVLPSILLRMPIPCAYVCEQKLLQLTCYPASFCACLFLVHTCVSKYLTSSSPHFAPLLQVSFMMQLARDPASFRTSSKPRDFQLLSSVPLLPAQAFLSRLLLMLGSFVIMCLLLF